MLNRVRELAAFRRRPPSARTGELRALGMKPPPPPTIDQLAASLGTTPEHVRAMGERYRRMVLGR